MDTPRTDTIADRHPDMFYKGQAQAVVDLSRTLERELSACRRDLEAEERGTANLNRCLDASRAECQRLREALASLDAALRTDSRGKTILSDAVEYHLDGQAMYKAINKARAALQEVQP